MPGNPDAWLLEPSARLAAASSAPGYMIAHLSPLGQEEMPGAVVQGETGDLAVGHFTANGQLDTAFGGAGTGFNVVSGARGFGIGGRWSRRRG